MTTDINHDLAVGHLDRCQICNQADLEEILDLGFQAPCDSLLWPRHLKEPERRYPLRLVRCVACGLAQIDHVVAAEELFFADYPYRSGITPSLVKNLRSTGPAIMQRLGITDGLAVDIGSNDGTLLSGFRDAGMRVLGVEPTNIASIAISNGIPTTQAFFTESVAERVRAEHGPASIVTAANMFAHVAALGSLIRGVESLLVDGGVFVSESHYLLDLLETVQYDSIYHEHLKYYSVSTIRRLLEHYDFTVVAVDRIPNYGGSIRVHAMKGKGHPVDRSVSDLLAQEERLGLHQRPVFDRFADQVRQSKRQMRQFLAQAQADGHRVVGVGCPGRAATLLGYCGIDTDAMAYVAEQSTSLKLGLFVPGCHIPIIDEQEMFDNPPEYAMILSWHYWEPIVRKLREKGLRSKIVLPLPELRVID